LRHCAKRPKGARLRENGADEDLMRDLIAEVWRAGTESADSKDRCAAVTYLIEKARDHQGYLNELSLRLLLSFYRDDFSDRNRETLHAMFDARQSPGLARVIGVAEVEQAVPSLKNSGQPAFAKRGSALKVDMPWAANLALARMGDEQALSRVMIRVDSEPDAVVRATQLFADLGYTKAPEAFAMLRLTLDSTERLPPLKATSVGDPVALSAAKVIAAHTEGSPVPGSGDRYLAEMLEWVAGLGEWPIIR